MPSYLVTGANRGIGLALVQALARDDANIVIGMARNSVVAESSVGNPRIHWVQGDLTDKKSLVAAVPKVSALTGGKLDVLIANASALPTFSSFDAMGDLLDSNPSALEEDLNTAFAVDVVGNIRLFHTFLPLIKTGSLKKVIAISTAMALTDLVLDLGIVNAGPYAISKAALNMAVSKFHVEYSPEDVLFMAISPGFVDTGAYDDLTPEQAQKMGTMAAKFKEYAPHMQGALKPEESASAVLKVIDGATVEANGGRMVSHHGNLHWI